MLTFRQKILITYLFVFVGILGLLFPFAHRTVKDIAANGMEDRADELIDNIKNAPNNEALVYTLKHQKPLIYFRVAVISNERKVLYDSHAKRVLGEKFDPEYVVDNPEVLEAFKSGVGYHEEYSELIGQEFAYLAKAFNFHGKTYVLRTAFPLKYVEEITRDFEFGILGSTVVVLLLFSLLTWFIINYFTRPIEEIITAVKPYQEGKTSTVPEIKLIPADRSDEFGKLANTLNSLSIKVRNHIEDVTRERNEKEVILESLVEGVVAVDENMIVTFANTMACKLLDLSIKNLVSHAFTEEMQPNCHKLLKRCQEENLILHETLELKKEGQKLFLNIVAAPTKVEKGAILVLHDTTEHFKIIEMRKDFIANASHELKTPITIIRGFAETLHDNPDLDQKIFAQITEKMVRNCDRMNELIGDLLTITDIDRIPEARLQITNLLDLVESSVSSVQDGYPTAHLHIEHDPENDYSLRVEPHLIELAIINLLTNAIKYSEPPADVTVSLKHKEDSIEIDVTDKGIGIPKEDLENIFQRFYMVNKARSHKVGGSGLGLSIVELIVSKHNGTISVDSEVGVGSTFTIKIPHSL